MGICGYSVGSMLFDFLTILVLRKRLSRTNIIKVATVNIAATTPGLSER
jgi:hypothetical protein